MLFKNKIVLFTLWSVPSSALLMKEINMKNTALLNFLAVIHFFSVLGIVFYLGYVKCFAHWRIAPTKY